MSVDAIHDVAWHARPVSDLSVVLGTDLESGLDEGDAARLLEEHGANQIVTGERWVRSRRLAAQFRDILVWLLLVAAAISGFLLDAWVDAAAIAVIVVLNAMIGYAQEARAQTALDRLREMEAPDATVVRNGLAARLPARDLVPGDLMVIEAGERIPADARIVWDLRLVVDEAPLTGESMPVLKNAGPIDAHTALADRTSMVYSGTTVVAGRGRAVVTATGMSTEVGRIAGLFTEEQPQTPLQVELARIGKRLGLLATAAAVVIFTAGVIRSFPIETMTLTAVAVAVAAIPEGLPAVITISLAGGLQRMARRNAVVRRLPAVETLGVVDVICTDKTGTLTSPELEVGEWWSPGPDDPRHDVATGWLAKTAALCNDAVRAAGGWSGDPTETALLVALEGDGVDVGAIMTQYPRLDEAAFDGRRKRMSTLHRGDAGYVLLVKGAPEVLVSRATSEATAAGPVVLDEPRRQAILGEADEMARRGMRTLAFALRDLDLAPDDPADAESELTMIGMVGLRERVRPEVSSAVARASGAGVRTVMVTGDHAATAAAVAAETGIGAGGLVEGVDLAGMSVESLTATVADHHVYARVDPADKVKIIEAWQASGAKVAMTGDGVNDAPALHRADIGVAMGSGTDVARESAAMVLTDDNYATIVSAIAEGRRLFSNLRNVVHYLLSANASEVFFVLVGFLAFGFIGEPLLAIQLLWINLVSDALPAISLGMEMPTRDLMADPPGRGRDVLSLGNTLALLAQGLILAGCALAVLLAGTFTLDLDHASVQTMVFTTLVFSQLLHAFSIRSRNATGTDWVRPGWLMIVSIAGSAFIQLLVVYHPLGNTFLQTVPIRADAMAWTVGMAVVSMTLIRLFNRFVSPRAE